MPRQNFDSLREFIAALDAAGELIRIKEPVSPILEITEITDRVSKMPGGGKALLFENVEGSEAPILINAFGSQKRMAMALGVTDLEEIASDIDDLIHMKAPESLMDKVALLPTLFRVSQFPPRVVTGKPVPCQEVVLTGDNADLSRIPVMQCWPDDGGRFFTLPCVITKSLAGIRNIGIYRMQIFNKNQTGMHWHIHKDGAHFFHDYAKAGKRMEVAVAVGCDPATVFAATAPMPHGIDELMLAGFIREKPVDLVKGVTVDLEVPRHAEYIIEGYVDAGDTRLEGPFGDHTGYYSLTGDYPVFHVTAITHRERPIYLSTIVGKPPMEDCYLGKATERIFLPLLKTVNPEIVDYDLPWEGVFHNCVIVSVAKRYPAQSRKLMSGLWGAGQMAFAKMILAVDGDVNVHDYEQVTRTLLDNIDISALVNAEGILDVLDHSAPKALYGSKLGVDATTPLSGEERDPIFSWGGRDTTPFEKAVEDHERILGCGIPYHDVNSPMAIVAIDKKEAGDGPNLLRNLAAADTENSIRIFMAVDPHVDPANWSVALWKFFNNVDPARDLFIEEERLFIDATKKIPGEGHNREWPDELTMSEDIIAIVDEKWERLNIR